MASDRDLLEAGGEDERGQPHLQGVVGTEAAGGVGELAHPGVALLERGDVGAGGLEGRAQGREDPDGAGEDLALGRGRHGGLTGGAGGLVGGVDVGGNGREGGGDLGVGEDGPGGDPGLLVLGDPTAQRVELARREGGGHRPGEVGEARGAEGLGEVGLGDLGPRDGVGVRVGGADEGVERLGDGGVVGGVRPAAGALGVLGDCLLGRLGDGRGLVGELGELLGEGCRRREGAVAGGGQRAGG